MDALAAVRLLDAIKQRLLLCSPDELAAVDVLLSRIERARCEAADAFAKAHPVEFGLNEFINAEPVTRPQPRRRK